MNIDRLERDIVKIINFRHGTKFKLKDLMEWATTPIEAQEGEILYEAGGYYCAFKLAKHNNVKDKE